MEFRKEDFLHTILPAAGPILVCVVLILLQPDLGTSIDIVLVTAAIPYVAGLSWKWLVTGAAAPLPILYLLITQVSYRPPRPLPFFRPCSHPPGSGFPLFPTLVAAGS